MLSRITAEHVHVKRAEHVSFMQKDLFVTCEDTTRLKPDEICASIIRAIFSSAFVFLILTHRSSRKKYFVKTPLVCIWLYFGPFMFYNDTTFRLCYWRLSVIACPLLRASVAMPKCYHQYNYEFTTVRRQNQEEPRKIRPDCFDITCREYLLQRVDYSSPFCLFAAACES